MTAKNLKSEIHKARLKVAAGVHEAHNAYSVKEEYLETTINSQRSRARRRNSNAFTTLIRELQTTRADETSTAPQFFIHLGDHGVASTVDGVRTEGTERRRKHHHSTIKHLKEERNDRGDENRTVLKTT